MVCHPEYLNRLVSAGELKSNEKFIFILESCENKAITDIVKRKWPVFIITKFRVLISRIFCDLHGGYSSADIYYKVARVFSKAKSTVQFTYEEEVLGKKLLKDMGIQETDWFVCFHGRDSAYLNSRFPERDWSYHDYRDTDITISYKAMEKIVELGGFAIRVGSHVTSSINKADRIIDYAQDYRTEFGDIYLLGKCRFMVACTAGLAGVPTMFDIPVAMTNLIPYVPGPHGAMDIFIPKLLMRAETQEILTFDECFELGLFFLDGEKSIYESAYYKECGLIVIENDEIDIVDVCCDMMDIIEGRPIQSDKILLQEAFHDKYFSHLTEKEFMPKIGPSFIYRYQKLMR